MSKRPMNGSAFVTKKPSVFFIKNTTTTKTF